ncbi:hypothetical protein BKH46_06990 [Helicobacter sp. 12S02634-8]|uniref:DUF2972 domain-containing protein n=1 Tax=Helicobacter sp. 12S02634-8 TaxID=1476199 RepID=UPI000BA4F739|nr:DUF2972 domain-containing protein [Helicobacter sp. 12S02634-8]PAF46702.1 hypothetical protein BKH46_06990 [Helicobacter sp. 12S02634-8]
MGGGADTKSKESKLDNPNKKQKIQIDNIESIESKAKSTAPHTLSNTPLDNTHQDFSHILKDPKLLTQAEAAITFMLKFLTQNITTQCHMLPFFCFSSALKPLQNTTAKIHYIDTQDFSSKEKAFVTMRSIAKILNLPFTNTIDDFDINYSSIHTTKALFPYTLTLPPHPTNPIHSPKLTLTTQPPPPNTQILCIHTFKNGLKIYATTQDTTPSHDPKALDAMMARIEECYVWLDGFLQKGGIERLILEVFKQSQTIKEQFKAFLAQEIAPITQLAPQIPKNWLYYQEFLTL